MTAFGFAFAAFLGWQAFEIGIRARWRSGGFAVALLSLEALLWALGVVGY